MKEWAASQSGRLAPASRRWVGACCAHRSRLCRRIAASFQLIGNIRLHRPVSGSRGGFARRGATVSVASECQGGIAHCCSTRRCCSLGQLRAASSSLASPSVAARQFVRADAGEHCAFTSRRWRRGSTQASGGSKCIASASYCPYLHLEVATIG
jgi:hypothetical protein